MNNYPYRTEVLVEYIIKLEELVEKARRRCKWWHLGKTKEHNLRVLFELESELKGAIIELNTREDYIRSRA